VAFSSAAPHALGWSPPAAIYLRATASETIAAAGGGTQDVTVSSQRAVGSVEDGLVVVTGRLSVASGAGSELLKLPLALSAQYWTGSSWDSNSGDNASAVGAGAAFSRCQKHLADGSAAANNCTPALALDSALPLVLANGGATAWLRAPGAGNDGSGFVQMDSGAPWLPATAARVVFGTQKGRFVFVREVY